MKSESSKKQADLIKIKDDFKLEKISTLTLVFLQGVLIMHKWQHPALSKLDSLPEEKYILLKLKPVFIDCLSSLILFSLQLKYSQ